jgi:type IV secretory pathway TraG/TraD family ATPase VirD4
MIIARLMFMIGVLLFAYALAVVGHAIPLVGSAAIVAAVLYVAKGAGKRLTTLGSARWADAEDLRKAKMLSAKRGIILGRLDYNGRHFLSALRALFNPLVDSMTACTRFHSALRRTPCGQFVKLGSHRRLRTHGGREGSLHRGALPSDLP